MNTHQGLLRHLVLFRFNTSATDRDVAALVRDFARLPKAIPEIETFEWGTDISPEGMSQGCSHCFLVTFRCEANRDRYLVHDAHKAFVRQIQPLLESALVLDYWARERGTG